MSPLVITVVLTVTAVLACCWLGQVCHTQASDWNVSATYVVVMGWLYFMPAAFASFTGNKVVSRDMTEIQSCCYCRTRLQWPG